MLVRYASPLLLLYHESKSRPEGRLSTARMSIAPYATPSQPGAYVRIYYNKKPPMRTASCVYIIPKI